MCDCATIELRNRLFHIKAVHPFHPQKISNFENGMFQANSIAECEIHTKTDVQGLLIEAAVTVQC